MFIETPVCDRDLQGERVCLILGQGCDIVLPGEGVTVFIECWSAWDGKIASLSALRVPPWIMYIMGALGAGRLDGETTPLRGVVYSLCAKRGILGGQPVCRVRRTPLS